MSLCRGTCICAFKMRNPGCRENCTGHPAADKQSWLHILPKLEMKNRWRLNRWKTGKIKRLAISTFSAFYCSKFLFFNPDIFILQKKINPWKEQSRQENALEQLTDEAGHCGGRGMSISQEPQNNFYQSNSSSWWQNTYLSSSEIIF